jgi:hypothetical protein
MTATIPCLGEEQPTTRHQPDYVKPYLGQEARISFTHKATSVQVSKSLLKSLQPSGFVSLELSSIALLKIVLHLAEGQVLSIQKTTIMN